MDTKFIIYFKITKSYTVAFEKEKSLFLFNPYLLMNNFLFYFQKEKEKILFCEKVLNSSHEELLNIFNISQETYLYLKLLNRKDKYAKCKIKKLIPDSNYFENIVYKYITNDIKFDFISAFFLLYIFGKLKTKPENKILYYIYIKDYKKVNHYLTNLKNPISFMFLFFCYDIKLTEETIMNVLKNINSDVLVDAYFIIEDKNLVCAFIVKYVKNDRIKLILKINEIENKNVFKECKIKLNELYQQDYIKHKKIKYYNENLEDMAFLGCDEDEIMQIKCSWLRLFIIYNIKTFFSIMEVEFLSCEEFSIYRKIYLHKNQERNENIMNTLLGYNDKNPFSNVSMKKIIKELNL